MNYLTVTRFDNAFSISVKSQFLSAQRTNHWGLVRILGYLKKTPGKGLLYLNCAHTKVVCFLDVNWVRSPILSKTRVFFLEEILCHEKTKSRVASRSSAESKYHAMTNVTFTSLILVE